MKNKIIGIKFEVWCAIKIPKKEFEKRFNQDVMIQKIKDELYQNIKNIDLETFEKSIKVYEKKWLRKKLMKKKKLKKSKK